MKINKKQIGLIAGLAAVIVLIVLLLTMCNGSGNGDHQGDPTQPIASEETTAPATEESVEASEETTEETEETTEETTEPTEETTEPTTGGNTRPGGSGGYVPDYGTDDDEDEESGDSTTETTPAAGSEKSPYTEVIGSFPDFFRSVTIPTDSTIYHNVFGAEGGVLTIEDSEAYVIYNGVTYEPNENGVVQVPLTLEKEEEETDAEAGETAEILPVSFQLGSKSAEVRSFLLSFQAPLGSMENPEVLEAVDGVISIDTALSAGDEDGYYYSYTSATGGILTLQLGEVTENVDCDIIVTVGETVLKLSEAEEGVLSVNLNPEEPALIQVITVPGEDGTYPAANIQIQGQVEDTSGTKENPIMIPGEFPIVTDVLEPGAEVYYSVYGAGGMILSIADLDAYVIIGEEVWTAVDGVVSGEVVSANPREPVIICVGNNGETAESYTVNFDYKPGTMMKPAQLVIGTNTAVVGENAMDGYWYTWTAEEDGILTLTMPEGNWMYLINNVTDSVYGEQQYSDAEDASNLVETEVSAGDELSIMVCTYDPADSFTIPAGEVVFEAYFNTKPGTKENPIWLTEMETKVEVQPGTPVYCNEVMSGVDMEVAGEGTFTVTYNGTNYAATNGVVTIPKVTGSRFNPVPVILTNYGTETAVYTVTFTYPVGSRVNPQLIEEMGEYIAPVEGDSEGYFYTWTAPADGEFTISVQGNDWTFVVNNETTSSYGEIHNSNEGAASAETVAVQAGDELLINVGTASGQSKDITLVVDFVDPTYGTEENPVWLTEMENIVTVRPGATVYGNVTFSNVIMTVTGPEEFSLTFGGKAYASENGVVTIPNVNASRYTPLQLILTNSGEEKVDYSVKFAYPVGSSMNPCVITEMGKYTANVVGDGEGYFYSWTAEADGVFVISVLSDDWTYVVNNLTSYVYGEIQKSSEGSPSSQTIEVKAGDEIQINIGTSSQQDKNVILEFDHYDPSVGTEENPLWLTDLENTVTVRSGATIYGNVLFSNVSMTVTGPEDFSLTFGGKEYTSENGVVTIPDVNASRYMPLQLILTNSGEEKVNYSVNFAYHVGSIMNPQVITEMGEYTADVVGDGEGYFFTWIAEADGALTVTMLSDDWVYVINNLTSYTYGGIRDSQSGNGSSETISVTAGDEIQINIGTASRKDKEVSVAFEFQALMALRKQEELVYEGTYTPKTFELDLQDVKEMGIVDLTESYELEASKAGIHHLHSKDGPLLVVDFTDDTFVNLAKLVETMEITIEVTDENGVVTIQSCNELLKQYIECAWVQEVSEDVTRTLYPLTEDLELIRMSLGEQLGWFDPDSEGYLFGDYVPEGTQDEPEELVQESLWMFSCRYVEFLMEETTATATEATESTEEMA